MKQYKRTFLVLIGLAFATLLGFLNFNNRTKLSSKEPAVLAPVTIGSNLQQMAIETVPAAPMQANAPSEEVFPRGQMIEAEPENSSELLSYVEFLSLPGGSPPQSAQISWREYLEYRRAFAKSPQAS